MNSCNRCNDCCDPCGGCKPAQFGNIFDIQVSPYDPSEWFVTLNGATNKVKVPKLKETDTKLSTDSSTSTLNYKAEAHTDTITGAQLGDIINVKNLRDVKIDDGVDGHCYELIYRKWAECGKGCRSVADKWENFNINTQGAKRAGIRYVRGANEFGCPVYLDVPERENEYWFGMWKPGGGDFEYVQPQRVDKLPTTEDGKIEVMGQDTNGKPIVGPLNASLSINAKEFVARNADPQGRFFFVPNSTTTQEFLVVPDDEPGWRAPCAGVLMVDYCVNPIGQAAGKGEIDVTIMLDNESWSEDRERYMSSHSTWTWTQGDTDCSESASAARIVPKGRTIKLHARDTGDVPGGKYDMSKRAGSWRVHAVRSVFIPLEIGA